MKQIKEAYIQGNFTHCLNLVHSEFQKYRNFQSLDDSDRLQFPKFNGPMGQRGNKSIFEQILSGNVSDSANQLSFKKQYLLHKCQRTHQGQSGAFESSSHHSPKIMKSDEVGQQEACKCQTLGIYLISLAYELGTKGGADLHDFLSGAFYY
mmetsp:Transcript_1010/g.1820  ORF Transcript_1010/g.1820 Transcript_1010/m.1820 type:complete len:151 (-) Transcript_1010:784-1236(-)